jgi:hypothetical protein
LLQPKFKVPPSTKYKMYFLFFSGFLIETYKYRYMLSSNSLLIRGHKCWQCRHAFSVYRWYPITQLMMVDVFGCPNYIKFLGHPFAVNTNPTNFIFQLPKGHHLQAHDRASTHYALFGRSLVFSCFHVLVSCKVWVKKEKTYPWIVNN